MDDGIAARRRICSLPVELEIAVPGLGLPHATGLLRSLSHAAGIACPGGEAVAGSAAAVAQEGHLEAEAAAGFEIATAHVPHQAAAGVISAGQIRAYSSRPVHSFSLQQEDVRH